jgi:hypothetical protein
LANLPNFALDRLSRYEAALWRQVGRILFALDALDRRKPQERARRFRIGRKNYRPTRVITVDFRVPAIQSVRSPLDTTSPANKSTFW